MQAMDFGTCLALAAQSRRQGMPCPAPMSGRETPGNPDTTATSGCGFSTATDGPAPPSPCATPSTCSAEPCGQPHMSLRQEYPDGVAMVPMMSPMCFIPQGVQDCGGAGHVMQACMMPAGMVTGWMGDPSFGICQFAFLACSQLPMVGDSPYMGG